MRIRQIFLTGIAGAAMALVSGAYGQAVSVVVNGQPISFATQPPIMENDRVFVPLRGVFEALGAHVDWNPSTQTVTAFRGSTKVQLTIGQTTASVDGSPVQLDVPAQVLQGSTMVPLRFVGEALGNNVRWDGSSNTVTITGNGDYQIPHHDHDHDHDWHPGPPPPPPLGVYEVPYEEFPQPVILHPHADIHLGINIDFDFGHPQIGQAFYAPVGQFHGLPPGSRVQGTVTNVTINKITNVRNVSIVYNNIVTPNGRKIPFHAHTDATVRGGHAEAASLVVHVDKELRIQPKKGAMPPHH